MNEEVSKIQIESGTYNIKDTTARNRIEEVNTNLSNTINENNENLENQINNKSGVINLMNYIIYDFNQNYYSQGLAINNNDLYVYREYDNTNGKLMKFNLESNNYISETNLDLKHGNDMVILNNILYSCNADGTKKITTYNLSNYSTNEITLNVDEDQIACITKEDEENLLILANNDYGSNFTNCGIYRYNITNSNLTKFNITNNFYLNFYAIQSFTYLNGYIYLLVSNPNQIIKIKVDSSLIFEYIYNIPEIDELGLTIGECEGIDNVPIFGENALLISTQIYDCEAVGRTLKTYIINPINNIPQKFLHYPNIDNIENIEPVQRIYVNNTTSLIELGTANYPFHSINRALNVVRNKKRYFDILLYNTANVNPYNLYVDTINNVHCGILTVNSNIVLNVKRILNSNIAFDSDENIILKIKNIPYGWGLNYGNITNSNIIFKNIDFDIRDIINIYKSNVKFYDVTGTANNEGNFIFRLRYMTEVTDGINWNNWTLNGKKPYNIYGVSKLFKISDIPLDSTDQNNFVTNNIDFSLSTGYCVIFNGIHTI